jgi:lysyl-tRNA synthetase class 2
MLEWYEAYADYHRVMDLAEALTKHLVKALTGGTKLQIKEHTIDVGGKWARLTIDELLDNYLGIKWDDVDDAKAKELQKKYNITVRGTWSKNKVLFALYDHEVTPKLLEPTWAIDYPSAVSPLSKTHRSKQVL